MKILITGIPRSGSSFLTRAPFYSLGKDPEKWIENKNIDLHFEEPALYSKEAEDIDGSDRVFNLIINHNLKFSKDFVIIRHHQLLFREDIMEKFEKIIICERQYDSWIESAKNHEHLSNRIKIRYNRDYKKYYDLFSEKIETLKNQKVNDNKYIFVNFESIESSKNFFYSFIDKAKVDETFKNLWTGSRWK